MAAARIGRRESSPTTFRRPSENIPCPWVVAGCNSDHGALQPCFLHFLFLSSHTATTELHPKAPVSARSDSESLRPTARAGGNLCIDRVRAEKSRCHHQNRNSERAQSTSPPRRA